MFKFLQKKTNVDEDLSQLIKESREDCESIALDDKEKELLSSAMRFYNTEAHAACVPTSDLVFVDVNDDFQTVLTKFMETKFNKILVVNNSIDSVLGFLNLVDLLEFVDKRKEFVLKEIVRECTFVPESLYLPKVISQMQHNRHSLAVVVDEYGGTSGIITIKDILAEFVGEIEEADEEFAYEELMVKLSDNIYHLDPRLELDDLKESIPEFYYDLHGEEQDFETFAGLLLQLAKRIPSKGDEIVLSDEWKAIVLDVDPRKINKVELQNVGKNSQIAE